MTREEAIQELKKYYPGYPDDVGFYKALDLAIAALRHPAEPREKLVRLPSGAYAGNGWLIRHTNNDPTCAIYYFGQFVDVQPCTADAAAAIINGETP